MAKLVSPPAFDVHDLRSVRGIGPARTAALQTEKGVATVEDLLSYFPYGYLDRSHVVRIADLKSYRPRSHADTPTVVAQVYRKEAPRSRRSQKVMFILTVRDDSGFMKCVWFHGYKWLNEAFDVGDVAAFSGEPVRDKRGFIQFVHPVFDRFRGDEDEPDWGSLFNTGKIIPKYSSTDALERVGLDSRGFRTVIRNALRTHADLIEETLPAAVLAKFGLRDRRSAFSAMHFPESEEDGAAARERLKFEELFYLQLMVALRRRRAAEDRRVQRYVVDGPGVGRFLTDLPFELTTAQTRVIGELRGDLRALHPMNRLLQGDVGSGKTVVALAAAMMAIDSGYQVAFMAPTEILAEQHYRTVRSLLGAQDVTVRLLTGGQRKKLREDVLEDVRSGRAQIVVGTHAVLEEHVAFANLGLVVIDEQHRFGVLQRAALRSKGHNPDVLVMTATPIPRTLAMTVYGDLDASVLDEMPANRKPVRTAIRTDADKEKIAAFLRTEVGRGRQVYIVLPLIEESEKVDLKAATVEFERLRTEVFPDLRLDLLHGRLKGEEKDGVMDRFKAGETQILVSTTVIEVGIDVPNATVMVVENAERFGLAQLHQLRGRVGRGADQSYCILMANYGWFDAHPGGKDTVGVAEEKDSARRRLETMVRTTDGFVVAEEDLKIRGPGEFYGTQQSGIPELRIARLDEDGALLLRARAEAFALVESDPHLRSSDHRCLRHTFDRRYKELVGLGLIG